MDYPFRISSILIATLCLAGCASERDLANQKALEQAFSSLLGSSPIDSTLTKVEIVAEKRRYVFASQGEGTPTIGDLKRVLRKGRLSPSDPRGRKFGSTRRKIGTVSVFSKDARRTYELCGTSDPRLFCVLVHSVGDTVGRSLHYFYFEDGQNPFQDAAPGRF